jgi:hypothetical protein
MPCKGARSPDRVAPAGTGGSRQGSRRVVEHGRGERLAGGPVCRKRLALAIATFRRRASRTGRGRPRDNQAAGRGSLHLGGGYQPPGRRTSEALTLVGDRERGQARLLHRPPPPSGQFRDEPETCRCPRSPCPKAQARRTSSVRRSRPSTNATWPSRTRSRPSIPIPWRASSSGESSSGSRRLLVNVCRCS